MVRAMKQPVVIGGAAVDIKGVPHGALRRGASNLGVLRRDTGGVALNIALDLAALGAAPAFISVTGCDADGDLVEARCRAAGLDTGRIARVDGEATAVFAAIIDEQGELVAGISAMKVLERITPAFLEPHRELIAGAPMVVLDANVPAETVAWLAALARSRGFPLWLEPTAFDACLRMKPHLGAAAWTSPNAEELEALSGLPVDTRAGQLAAARALRSLGVANVAVTLGAGGVIHAGPGGETEIAAPAAAVVDATGAGDAFVAGTVAGLLGGLDTPAALRRGMAAARLALQVPESVLARLEPGLLAATERDCFNRGAATTPHGLDRPNGAGHGS